MPSRRELACSIPMPSGLKGQERSLYLVELRYFFFSFDRVPSHSFFLPLHRKTFPVVAGLYRLSGQLTAWITQGYIVSLQEPATLSASLGTRAHYGADTSTPVAVLKLEIPRQQAVLQMLLSKSFSLLSLLEYKPTPNQLFE